MTLTVERINEIRKEMEHNLPLSIEDRNALFELALSAAGADVVAQPVTEAAAPAKAKVSTKKAKADPVEAAEAAPATEEVQA